MIEEGEMALINGGMKGIDAAVFFSSGGGVGVDPGGGVRPAGGALRAQLWCGRKKKVAGWAVRMGWAGLEAEAQWGRGGRKMAGWKKKEWAVAGLKGWMGRK
jgi:endonuclease YncB( thermonuclease family)